MTSPRATETGAQLAAGVSGRTVHTPAAFLIPASFSNQGFVSVALKKWTNHQRNPKLVSCDHFLAIFIPIGLYD